MSSTYMRGSEWRKWDLHFHTPSSYDYDDKSVTNENIIGELINSDVAVVAITDHHIIDIERIKELQKLAQYTKLTILPGIEFLSDARGNEPIHFIGIFSEYCNIEHIWGQIQNRTAISKIRGEGKAVNQVYCDLVETVSLIHELGGVVSIHAGTKHGSIEKITNALPHAMAQKEDIANGIDLYEIGKESDQSGYIQVVFPAIHKTIPMILCSDNHNVEKYNIKSNCWIKADPTFDGLKQAINEPEERVFIGSKPPLFDRIALNRTKFIDKISIIKKEDYDNKYGIWFGSPEPILINRELVAIIGNKGSGKSALADVIACCSNIKDGFSFLNEKKFLEKNGQLAKNFDANLVWEDGTEDKINLFTGKNGLGKVKVKYLTQGAFEGLTNEVDGIKEFQKEIENVVFSYIPEEERIGANNFQELIDKKSTSIEFKLRSIHEKLVQLNTTIIQLERKNTSNYRTEIENNFQRKNEELNALVEPKAVTDPNNDPIKKLESEKTTQQIELLRKEISDLEIKINEVKSKKEQKINVLNILETLKSDTEEHLRIIARFIENTKTKLSAFPINIEKLLNINSDFTELNSIILDNQNELRSIRELLGEIVPSVQDHETKSLSTQLIEKQEMLQREFDKLNTEQKTYQTYLTEKSKWEKEKETIIGKPDITGSYSFFKAEIEYLDDKINQDLQKLYEERILIAREIYKNRRELIDLYKNAKERLNEIIKSHEDILEDYSITIDASMTVRADFSRKFLGQINKNKSGTFYSNEGSEEQLRFILSECDFDNENAVISLLEKVMEAFKIDKRKGFENESRVIFDQVSNVHELYNYLFTLEFLDKNYKLKQGDKELLKLSPGERGALLLVFYLLLDRDNTPLIIDQPEDNLDNHSVATTLVPFIKKAKSKRQIIMVTHNPNLAVVADAEQVICVKLDKENENKFTWVSGSIENHRINEKIVEVLEGAMPAFNTRKRKYYE
ncbi:TrlF family AAA-like ATPase [Sphaerochaeta sp.]|uniref:TrlF family AAA-like ATPase n=1 Tax=Sphaerochaeta sp. TaxID=1972642 RepID=UPI003D0F7800